MPSKWEDYWDFTEWADLETKNVVSQNIFDMCAKAAWERRCFAEMKHLENLVFAEIFPDYFDAVLRFRNNTGNALNANLIKNNVYPHDCIKTDSILTSGVASSDSDVPVSLPLTHPTNEDLLQDVLGYASDTMLHISGSTDGTFSKNCIPFSSWGKQWFEILNYPKYYNFSLTYTNRFEFFETIQIEVYVQYDIPSAEDTNVGVDDIRYAYEYLTVNGTGGVGTGMGTSFAAEYSNYIGGANAFPPAWGQTPADVKARAIEIFEDAYADDSNWVAFDSGSSVAGSYTVPKATFQSWGSRYSLPPSAIPDITPFARMESSYCFLTFSAVRFKPYPLKRATTGQTYNAKFYFNGYKLKETLSGGDDSASDDPMVGAPVALTDDGDFTLAVTDKTIIFPELTAAGDGYFYINPLEILGFDFTDHTMATIPTAVALDAYVIDELSYTYTLYNFSGDSIALKFLSPDEDWTNGTTTVYTMPNDTSGNAFQYFTPP